jgi:hypothetical protein
MFNEANEVVETVTLSIIENATGVLKKLFKGARYEKVGVVTNFGAMRYVEFKAGNKSVLVNEVSTGKAPVLHEGRLTRWVPVGMSLI